MESEVWVAELRRLKALTDTLHELGKQSTLSRNACQAVIEDIERILNSLRTFLSTKACMELATDPKRLVLLDTVSQTFLRKPILALIRDSIEEIIPSYTEFSSLKSYLSSSTYSDDAIKSYISDLVKRMDRTLITATQLTEKLGVLYPSIPAIYELLGSFPELFTQNWVVATCYLSALEIALNKKINALQIAIGEEGKFKTKYDKVLQEIQKQGIQIPEMDKELPKLFWDIRHKVIHEGYSPTDEELNLITKYSMRILKLLISGVKNEHGSCSASRKMF
jgi:hypothetical protein